MRSYADRRLLVFGVQRPVFGGAKLWSFAVTGQFDEKSYRLGGVPGVAKKV